MLNPVQRMVLIDFFGNLVRAGGRALADGIQKTGAEETLAGVVLANFQVAGAELKRPLQVRHQKRPVRVAGPLRVRCGRIAVDAFTLGVNMEQQASGAGLTAAPTATPRGRMGRCRCAQGRARCASRGGLTPGQSTKTYKNQ